MDDITFAATRMRFHDRHRPFIEECSWLIKRSNFCPSGSGERLKAASIAALGIVAGCPAIIIYGDLINARHVESANLFHGIDLRVQLPPFVAAEFLWVLYVHARLITGKELNRAR